MTRRAFDCNLAAMEFNEFLADGEAKPGAAEAAGDRAVNLRKGLKQLMLMLRRDADSGVFDGDFHAIVRRDSRDDVHKPAGARELDGVREQVDHDLPESIGIGIHTQVDAFVFDIETKHDRLILRLRANQCERAFDFGGEIEVLARSSILPASIFETSKISLISVSKCRPPADISIVHSR